MKKILFINSVLGTGSTGKIVGELAEEYEAAGYEVKCAYGRNFDVPQKYKKYGIVIGDSKTVKLHAIYTRLTDKHGLGSRKATTKFLKWAETYRPDILWLHNLHGYYINYEMLFAWIKRHPEMEVKWTLHDCWAFTGHCSYFSYVKCENWKSGCKYCPQSKEYPKAYISASSENFLRKRKAFCGIQNMTLITPSEWLLKLVKESFLGSYSIVVKRNVVDRNIFKPTPSSFAKDYLLSEKRIVLGVASPWGERKGLEDFLNLSDSLGEQFAVVMVGLTRKQIKRIYAKRRKTYSLEWDKGTAVLTSKCTNERPSKMMRSCFVSQAIEPGVENIRSALRVVGSSLGAWRMILIPRTNSQEQLATLYSAADVFVNPTKEDNFPTVNLEAVACGTPVVTYNVGGCAETIRAVDSSRLETFAEEGAS